ncbi:MAG: SgcJ/EcaC family oxidoreductase [Ferruginibacter sp.]
MTVESYKPKSADDVVVLDLYYGLLEAWNNQDAHAFAHFFSGTAHVIGFDGSQMLGQEQVEEALKKIFEDHRTGIYISKVKDIERLDTHCMLLSAVAGMIAPGQNEIDPSKNAIQSLVFIKKNESWLIELFQNTPAQFHGRPELAETLTNELKELT